VKRALSATLLSRSIRIFIYRKLPTETVDAFSLADLAAVTEGLRGRLENFRANFIPPAEAPAMPNLLRDRERELWLPLFAIADQAPGWGTRCWNASIKLTEASRHEEPDDAVLLLADIREAFGTRDKLFSEELLSAIRNLEDPHYDGPATRTPKALANELAPHRIFPRQIRIGKVTQKGYLRGDFKNAFARYPLPTEQTEPPETPETEKD
jgi:putative DNA primase/helicase